MAVLFNNNEKVDFSAIKKKFINKSTFLYVTILLPTCWLSVVTSKSIVLIMSPSLLQETLFFGTKIFLLLLTISSWSSILAAVLGMSSFWLYFDKFRGEDIPTVEVLVFLFLPNIACTLFSKFRLPMVKVGWGFPAVGSPPQKS